MERWYFAQELDDLDQRILRMSEGTFSLKTARKMECNPGF